MDSGADELPIQVKVAFLSSFTVDPLVDFTIVEAAADGIGLQSCIAPFGQVSQEILNPQSGLYSCAADVTVLMAEPDSLAANPLEASDELIKLSLMWQEKGTGTLAVSTFMAALGWPLHLLESASQTELKQANDRLKEAFEDLNCIDRF